MLPREIRKYVLTVDSETETENKSPRPTGYILVCSTLHLTVVRQVESDHAEEWAHILQTGIGGTTSALESGL